MRRISLFMVWVTVVFVGMITVTVMFGQRQSLAENVVRLRLTDCEPPCWIGIKPGLTMEGRAQTLFSAAYPPHKPYTIAASSGNGVLRMQTNSNPPKPSDLVMGMLIGDMDSTRGVGVADSALMPSLGDVLTLWGLPTCIYPEAPDFWRLHYVSGSDGLSVADIVIKGNHFAPSQPTYYLMFYRAPAAFATRCSRDDAKRWSGFARLS